MTKKATQIPLPLSYPDSGKWFVPVKRIKIDDRTWALRLGQPVQLGTSYDVAEATGVGRKILKRMARAGFIQEMRPSPNVSMYYYTEVLDLMERTRKDPNFWTQVRRDAYLKGSRMEDASTL